jgi:hypothetical protein
MEFIPKPKIVTYERGIDVQTDLGSFTSQVKEDEDFHIENNLASVAADRIASQPMQIGLVSSSAAVGPDGQPLNDD